MPPKDDPETAKLRKELEDLMNKIKVPLSRTPSLRSNLLKITNGFDSTS